MLEPAVSVLREKTDSRYSLVVMAAKRARDLVDGKPALIREDELMKMGLTKPVSIAVNEIARDLVSYNMNVAIERDEMNE